MSSQDLMNLVYAALTATPTSTDADDRVYKPGDWPTQQDQYPILRLRLTTEDRTSLGRGGPPEFTTVANVQIVGEVSMPAEVENAGATAAEAALWALKRQVEVAVINSYPLTAQIQQFPTMRSQISFDSSGATHLAAITIDLALEFYEGPEDFAPIAADDLDEVDVTFTNFPPTGFVADLNP